MRKSNKTGLEALKKVLVVFIIGAMLFTNVISPVKALDTLGETPVEEQNEEIEEISDTTERSVEGSSEEEPEIPAKQAEEPVEDEEVPEEVPQEEIPEEEPAEEAPAEEVPEEVPAEEPAEEEPVKEAPAEEAVYPEAYFEGEAGVVSVKVFAPEGAFPEGTTMKVASVNSKAVEKVAEGLVDESTGRSHAVNITFYNADGEEVEPLAPINVSMSASDIADENAVIVHMPNNGAAEVVDSEVAEEGISFETDQFSVYVVVETGEDARLTVIFKNGDTEVAQMIVKKSDIDKQAADGSGSVFEQIIYDPGVGEIPEDQVFRGWTDKETYTMDDAESAMTIEDVRDAVKAKLNEGITDGDTYTINAMMFKVINVTFKDELGIVIKGEGLLTVGDDPVTYEVTETYVPKTSDQEFQGWYVNSAGTVTDADGNTIENGTAIQTDTTIKVTDDTILSAKAPAGFWLIFKENGTGASYTAPQFLEGVKPTEPADPARYGYTFEGWYKDAACSDGQEFDFDQLLEKTTTVYAKWVENTTASYNVIIWKQNVKGNGYDFAESVKFENGTVGQNINKVTESGTGNGKYASVDEKAKKYTGFHLDQYDKNVKIKSDGTSVVNVYYNRNEVKLTFVHRGRQNWVTDHEMTGLYGSSLKDNGYTWPTEYDWYDDYDYDFMYGYYGAGTRTTFLDAFILSDGGSEQTFYGFNGSGRDTVRFYKQNADGGYPGLNSPTNQVTADGSATFNISDKYNGYHAAEYSTNGTTWTRLGNKDSDGYYAKVSGYRNLYIRYAPDLYNIQYNDGIYVDGNGNEAEGYSSRGELKVVEDIPYASNMASYNKGKANYYAPEFAEFTFVGWYVDDTCTQPYTFTTMPEGLKVYAKWVQNEYRVFLHPNVPTSDTSFSMGGQNTSFRVSSGEQISQITAVRDEYELVGWYSDEACKKPFNFDAYTLNEDTTNEYDKSRPTELNEYGDPTSSENKDKDREWINKCLDLYAKWRSKLIGAEGITVVYDAGEDGSFAGDKETYTDPLLYKDTARAVATGAATASDPETKEFSHWVVQKWNGSDFEDTEETVYPGDGFDVLKAYTEQTENDDHTEENPSYTYTFKLRAEYKDLDEEKLTHIYWYANNETEAVKKVEELHMNEAVDIESADLFSYENHKFIGWARYKEGQKPSSPTDTTNLWLEYDEANDKFMHEGEEAEQVACDEKDPYHDLYAVWAPEISVRVSADTQEVPYNGSEQKYDYTKEGAYKVEYKVGAEDWTTEKPEGIKLNETKPEIKGTDVDTYTGKVKVSIEPEEGAHVAISDEGKEAEATATLKITPAEITITITGNKDSLPYNGKEQKVEGYEAACDDDLFDESKVSYDGEAVAKGTDADTYPMGLAEDKFSYDDKNVTATFEVTDGELEITPVEITITITGNKDSLPYNGKEQKVEGYEAACDDDLFDESKVSYDGEAVAKGTDAGTYPRGLAEDKFSYDDENVTATFEVTDGELKITGKEITITITGNKDSLLYNGEEQKVEGYEATCDDKVFDEGKVSYDGEAVAKGTDAGTYPMGLAEDKFSYDDENITATFEVTDGELEITPLDVTVTITGNKATKTYTGEAQSVEGYKVKASSDLYKESDVTFSEEAEAKAEGTNAGTYKMGLTAGMFNNTNDNFKVTFKVTDGQLKINPMTITLTSEGAEKVYDGEPLTNENVTMEGDMPAADKEKFTFKATGSQTYVGESPNTIEYSFEADSEIKPTSSDNAIVMLEDAIVLAADETSTASNYKIVLNEGTLKVTKPEDEDVVTKTHEDGEYGVGDEITFTIEVTNVYDENKTITIEELEGVEVEQSTFKDVKPGETVTTTATYVVTDKDAEAGTFKNKVTVKFSGEDDEFTGEDEVPVEKKGHAVIEKTVTNEPKNKKGFVEGETIEYEIKITNDGNTTLTNITITDELTGDEWTVEELAVDKSETFTAKYKVTAKDVKAGSVTNIATAEGEGDPTIEPGEVETPTYEESEEPSPTPSTGDHTNMFLWLAIMLAAGLELASLIYVRVRKNN